MSELSLLDHNESGNLTPNSMSSAYDDVILQKVKLKRGAAPERYYGEAKKFKRRRRKAKTVAKPEADDIVSGESVTSIEEPKSIATLDSEETHGKTAAELAFEKQRLKAEERAAEKSASKSHREKVVEFNERLANMSEHFDIPKVGPG